MEHVFLLIVCLYQFLYYIFHISVIGILCEGKWGLVSDSPNMVKETVGLLSCESSYMVVQLSLIIFSIQYFLHSVVVDMVEGSLFSDICECMFLSLVSTVS